MLHGDGFTTKSVRNPKRGCQGNILEGTEESPDAENLKDHREIYRVGHIHLVHDQESQGGGSILTGGLDKRFSSSSPDGHIVSSY